VTAPPTGTVTFLFTDLEGSTRLWEEFPDAMRDALARHDALVNGAVAAHEGYVVKTTGDGVHAAFATANDAVDAALAAQRALVSETWGDTGPLRVRMGLHTGTSELRDGDYYGAVVNRAARLMSVAHGGQVVCSQATADLVRDDLPAPAALVDLGEHRLRDLGTPERVFQVVHADLRAEFPALRSLDAFPGNLPLQLSAFVGRDEELAALSKMLDRERLVTLTGTGGVGKTRLALQAAAAALPNFPDGAWFVDLAPVGDPDFVASEIATAMGLLENRQGTPEEALVNALAHRHALVVLDNCEHVVDVAARVADLIVRRCPHMTVMATSQEALGVDGETTYSLRPLPVDDASLLFVERATAARHGFELTTDNAATVGELCRRLDGIPLAIELAAARVASMSVSSILERIDERFRLLAQGRRTARARHQTLRAAVDWSYGLLEAEEQLVFDRLSVFAGDFTLEAAEAVVTDDALDALDLLDLLAGLVAKSMLVLDDTGPRDHYRLLETMRDFGHQRLSERNELERLEERHAEHYLQLALAAEPHFVGRDDTVWIDRIAEEYPNVRGALASTRERDEAGYERFVFALARFWRNLGQHREGLTWITSALPLHAAAGAHQRAEVLAAAGQMAVNLARYDEGSALLEQSLECSAAAGKPPRSLALMNLALAALMQNRPDDARRFGEEAVAVARIDGDAYRLGEALGGASMAIALTLDDPRGIELADEGLEIARTLGSEYLLASLLEAAGIARYRIDPTRAVELLAASLDASSRNTTVTGQSRFIKAVAHLTLRQFADAAGNLCVALSSMQESGEPYYQSMALALAAVVLSRRAPDLSVRILALIGRLRDEAQFIGAPRDLDAQALLRSRLAEQLDAERFAALWAEGRAMTLDEAVAIALEELAVIAEAE
jgi:predicted ATPase/class 3 adenylate cyclase